MMISTKGRYALRIMVDVAQHEGSTPVSVREIAKRQEISGKYMEQIISVLTRNSLLRSVRGKGGGYALVNDPSTVKVGDVLRAVEGTTAPVACRALEEGAMCPRESSCATVRFWEGLGEAIERYVDGATLADLAFPGASASTCLD